MEAMTRSDPPRDTARLIPGRDLRDYFIHTSTSPVDGREHRSERRMWFCSLQAQI